MCSVIVTLDSDLFIVVSNGRNVHDLILYVVLAGVRVGGAISMNPGPPSASQRDFPPLPPAPEVNKPEITGDCKSDMKIGEDVWLYKMLCDVFSDVCSV